MRRAALRPRWQRPLQRVLIALLAVNCLVYSLERPWREAADALAWFALLVLFYLEASSREPRPAWAAAIRCGRLAAAAAIAAAGWAYMQAGAWLDACNTALWIGVVALLEAQIRRPALAARHRAACMRAALLLYGGLAVLPVVWLAQREWLAAYDAVLWLAAFATIEADVLPRQPRRAVTPARTPLETTR